MSILVRLYSNAMGHLKLLFQYLPTRGSVIPFVEMAAIGDRHWESHSLLGSTPFFDSTAEQSGTVLIPITAVR